MRQIISAIGIIIAIAALIFALVFAGNAMGLFNIKFWGVKYADAKRDVFEHSKSYVHGTIRDIENLCLEIQRTQDLDSKQAIRATMNHRIAAFDGEIPAHVRDCVNNQ